MHRRLFWKRGLLVWLLVCLLSSALLYAEQIRRQYWQLTGDFNTLFSGLSAVLTQNESIIPLLGGHEPLGELQKKFPQIQALEATSGRERDAARVEPTHDGRYWLYNPWRQIRVLINLQPLIQLPSGFSQTQIHLEAPPRTTSEAFWHWQRTFNQHFQPFVLEAEARPAWRQVAFLPHLLLWLGWAAVITAGGMLLWQRRLRRFADERADYYQHARLNTLGEITAGIVHEINQPLTATQTWIQGAQRQLNQGQTDPARQALTAALTQTQRIADLLTRFRAHVVEEAVSLEATDLTLCWQRVGDLLEHERTAKHITISQTFAADAIIVLADRLWLEQVLHNLLRNAIAAQRESAHGWVNLSSERYGEQINVVITDGGPGFSPEALENAFMPFYSERKEGIGLGMTLTESLMLRMNGSITLGNAPEGGARITLTFNGSQTSHG